jgi:hypothetical protein
MRVKLGQMVRDQITDITGVVTARVEYLTGCEQVLVQPKSKDNSYIESRWFDEDRVVIVDEKPLVLKVTHNGPDREAPRK